MRLCYSYRMAKQHNIEGYLNETNLTPMELYDAQLAAHGTTNHNWPLVTWVKYLLNMHRQTRKKMAVLEKRITRLEFELYNGKTTKEKSFDFLPHNQALESADNAIQSDSG